VYLQLAMLLIRIIAKQLLQQGVAVKLPLRLNDFCRLKDYNSDNLGVI
jgi:hypothetical protein